VIRVIAIYQQPVDDARYAEHVKLCDQVPGSTFRHGKVLRTLFGEPLHYYAEFDFPDMDAFKAASETDIFKTTGKDAADMGVPHSVYLVDVA
jgi:hypothetical protein